MLGQPKTWENLMPAPNQGSLREVHGTVKFCWVRTWVQGRGSRAGNAGSEQFSPIFRGAPVLVLAEISLCMDTYKEIQDTACVTIPFCSSWHLPLVEG